MRKLSSGIPNRCLLPALPGSDFKGASRPLDAFATGFLAWFGGPGGGAEKCRITADLGVKKVGTRPDQTGIFGNFQVEPNWIPTESKTDYRGFP